VVSEFPTQPTGEYAAPPSWEPPRRLRNGAGTSALVLGVLALVLAILVLTSPVAAILGIIAIVLGIVGIGRAERGEATNRGSAIAGLITGLLALALVALIVVSFARSASGTERFTSRHASDFRIFGTCMRNASNDADRSACLRQLSDQINQQ